MAELELSIAVLLGILSLSFFYFLQWTWKMLRDSSTFTLCTSFISLVPQLVLPDGMRMLRGAAASWKGEMLSPGAVSWLAWFGACGFQGKGNCWVPAWVWRVLRWCN